MTDPHDPAPASAEPVVTLEDASFSYGPSTVLTGVTGQVPAGQALALVGHHGVYSVAFEALEAALRCCHISVSNNGDVHSRVILYTPDKTPVGFSLVHLCPCTSVYGQGSDAAVL